MHGFVNSAGNPHSVPLSKLRMESGAANYQIKSLVGVKKSGLNWMQPFRQSKYNFQFRKKPRTISGLLPNSRFQL